MAPLEIPRSKAKIEFGKPITILEDGSKATFEYKAGAWVPFAMTIAECRLQNCQVSELPQKMKDMTRYEIRLPLEA